MTQIVLPNTSVTGANLWSQVEDNDQAIVDVVNGDIGADNLASAAVTTAKIADDAVTSAKIADSTTSTATINAGTGTITARKFAAGLILLSGSVTKSSGNFASGEVFATLAAGFRPPSGAEGIGFVFDGGNAGVARIQINSSGQISRYESTQNPTIVLVNGIVFDVA